MGGIFRKKGCTGRIDCALNPAVLTGEFSVTASTPYLLGAKRSSPEARGLGKPSPAYA